MELPGDVPATVHDGQGRESRSESFATRLTKSELKLLLRAAAKDGMKVREWARETLLREAGRSEDILFIELIATRMFLVNLLKPLTMGKLVTPERFEQISASVRADKRKIALKIQQNYIAEAARNAQ
jgi:hypothetical protein